MPDLDNIQNNIYYKVIVACHGMMIQAVTGGKHPTNGEIVEFKL